MQALYFVLFLLSAIMFLASAVNATVRRVNVLALGLFFFALVFVLQALQKL